MNIVENAAAAPFPPFDFNPLFRTDRLVRRALLSDESGEMP
jgi:hypothetical protein